MICGCDLLSTHVVFRQNHPNPVLLANGPKDVLNLLFGLRLADQRTPRAMDYLIASNSQLSELVTAWGLSRLERLREKGVGRCSGSGCYPRCQKAGAAWLFLWAYEALSGLHRGLSNRFLETVRKVLSTSIKPRLRGSPQMGEDVFSPLQATSGLAW